LRSSLDCEYPEDDGTYYLPVVFHNFSSQPLFPDEMQIVIEKMQTYFENHDQRVIPVLAKFDVAGNCFSGIIDHQAGITEPLDTHVDVVIDYFFPNNSFAQYQERYINIFAFEEFTSQQVIAFTARLEREKNYIAYTRQPPFMSDYNNLGRILGHELGHFCSLLHPHGDFPDDGCSADPCTGQDMITDTPIGPFRDVLFSNPGCGLRPFCNNSGFNQSNLMTVGQLPSEDCDNHFLSEGQMDRISKCLNDKHEHLHTAFNLERTLGLTPVTIAADITYQNVTLTQETFEVLDNVTINILGNVVMNNCDYYMGRNTKIIVTPGAKLILSGTVLTSFCNKSIWYGVEVKSNGTLETKNQTRIDGAKIGVFGEYGATRIRLDKTSFQDCQIGVKLGEEGGSGLIRNWISRCSIVSGVFEGRVPTPDFLTTKYGIAAYDIGSLNVWPKNYFEKNETAVLSKNNYNNLSENTTENCKIGIDIDNAVSKNYSYINKTIIKNEFCGLNENCRRPGIRILGGEVTVTNNDIKASTGLDLSAVTGVESFTPEKHIYNNIFRGCEKRALALKSSNNISVLLSNDLWSNSKEVFFGDTRDIHVFDNEFYQENLRIIFSRYSNFSDNFFVALNMSGSNYENILYNNQISGVSNIISSPSNVYNCNYMGETTYKSNNLGSILQANSFGSEFNITGATTQISPQINRGNLFTNVTANFGAGLSVLDNNIFVIKNASPYVPYAINGPATWFNPNGLTDQPNCETTPTFDSPWEADQFAKCVDSLFQGTKYARFSTQQKWSILLTLYRIYKKRGIEFPFNLSVCAVRILNDYGQHVVGKIDRLCEKVDSLRGLRVTGPATDSIRTIQQSVIDMMENQEDPDSIALVSDQINIYAYDRQQEWNTCNSGYLSLKNEILQTAIQLENETTVEPFVYLAKLVPSLIAYHEGDTTHFDAQRLDFLEDVILACDTIAGEATYIAAYLYEVVTGHDLSQYMDCQQNPLPRTIKTPTKIIVYPNPASDILFVDGEEEEMQIEFYNITGTLIRTHFSSGKQSIDIRDLPSGVYLIKVQLPKAGIEQVLKLIKL
jgi:hypothetical protein